MEQRANKNRVSPDTDKHLCLFLLSSFRKSGLKVYKNRNNLSFPEPIRKISHRLEYLKKLHDTSFTQFAKICESLGINSSKPTPNFIPSNENVPPHKVQVQSPPATILKKPASMSVSDSDSSNGLDQVPMRKHDVFLNFDCPSLNSNGMMWFRDDDVEIGESMYSVLTIYQPLFDARDHDLIKLYMNPQDPTVLYHVHPNVPTFMFKDYDKIHKLEKSDDNPDLFSLTRKRHKKHAFKILSNKNLKVQMTEYQLPFSVTMEAFDQVNNLPTEIQKHYRTIEVDVDAGSKISHTCAYIYWKIMIDGETTNCSTKAHDDQNVFAEAQNRMSEAFKQMNVS